MLTWLYYEGKEYECLKSVAKEAISGTIRKTVMDEE